MPRLCSLGILPPFLLLAPGLAQAQRPQPPPADPQDRAQVEQQLQDLLRTKQDLEKTFAEFNSRIATLEAQLGTGASDHPAPANSTANRSTTVSGAGLRGAVDAAGVAAISASAPAVASDTSTGAAPWKNAADITSATTGAAAQQPSANSSAAAPAQNKRADYEKWGPFDPDVGVILTSGPLGELSWGVRGYVRYLNEGNLAPTYTDSFGRTFVIDRREDIQINRLQLNFRGWLFDPKFRYTWYAWTQNVSMGDPAQVVVAGNLNYKFSDALTVQYELFSLPSTRSTAQSFPNWLRIDHRTMADEYFRGSYSTGIRLSGDLTDTLSYNVAATDNLSQLGISASQLGRGPHTFSGTIYWMPTTGEFGPQAGFGDYEYHTKLATLLGVHYTYSREDKQEQPGVNAFENAQIRLSDGTLLFSADPFLTGGTINRATYQMLDLDGGLKYMGWSLEGEYYFRWLNNFEVTGTIPVTSLFDQGFQLQASTMIKPDVLQAYVSGSQIFGQYGNPWDVGIGLNYFPYGVRTVRFNFQALYMDRSAVGYTAIPYQVGGTGWVFTFDTGTWF